MKMTVHFHRLISLRLWAEGKLSTFDAVALVRLRDLNEHDVHEVDQILPHLLFLATGNSISKEMATMSHR